MVEISFKNSDLIINVLGTHKFWCFKSKIQVPISNIKQVKINNGTIKSPPKLRLLGTYFPGVIIAGTYGWSKNKAFWDVVHKNKSIVLDLQNHKYKQIVVEVENPEVTVKAIKDKIQH